MGTTPSIIALQGSYKLYLIKLKVIKTLPHLISNFIQKRGDPEVASKIMGKRQEL